jgi:hypothetical protein
MRIEGDTIIFSSGREFYANRGVIGLSDDLYVSQGYDGGLDAWPSEGTTHFMTPEERRELADYMIALWTKFREADGPIPDQD